jgi:hypothetical protein
MQSTSKSSLLIYIILALFLFSWLWAFFNYDEPVRYIKPLNVEMHERIIEKEKIKRITLLKELNHYDTIFLDTFDATSSGLEGAIRLHRFCDSALSE